MPRACGHGRGARWLGCYGEPTRLASKPFPAGVLTVPGTRGGAAKQRWPRVLARRGWGGVRATMPLSKSSSRTGQSVVSLRVRSLSSATSWCTDRETGAMIEAAACVAQSTRGKDRTPRVYFTARRTPRAAPVAVVVVAASSAVVPRARWSTGPRVAGQRHPALPGAEPQGGAWRVRRWLNAASWRMPRPHAGGQGGVSVGKHPASAYRKPHRSPQCLHIRRRQFGPALKLRR